MIDRAPLDPGGARWAVAITATGPAAVRAVAFAGSDVIAAGEFDGTLAIGEIRARSHGGRDGFVARLDRRGAPVWVKTFGGPGDDRITAIDAAAGAIAIGGEHQARLAIGATALVAAGAPDGFVASLSSSGEVRWAAGIGASRYAGVTSVALTDNGELLAAGQFAGSLDSGGAEVHAAGSQDAFIARWSAGGERRWFRRAGGPGSDVAAAIAAGPGGEIAVAGSMMDGATFGATELETTGAAPDAFVARLDQRGAFIWVRQLGGPGSDGATALAIEGDAIACAGRFSRDLEGAGSPLSSAGATDGFVVWLSLGGQPLRATSVGGEAADWLAAIAAGDGVVIGGAFADRAGADLQSAGALDGLVGKLAGTQSRWRRPIGGSGDDAVNAVALGPDGLVALGATFSGSLTIDGNRGITLRAGPHPAGAVVLLEP